jgi:hypothetical protein
MARQGKVGAHCSSKYKVLYRDASVRFLLSLADRWRNGRNSFLSDCPTRSGRSYGWWRRRSQPVTTPLGGRKKRLAHLHLAKEAMYPVTNTGRWGVGSIASFARMLKGSMLSCSRFLPCWR